MITFAGLGRLYLSNSPGRETAAVTLLQQFNCTFAWLPACHCAHVLVVLGLLLLLQLHLGYSSFIVSIASLATEHVRLKCRSKVSQMMIIKEPGGVVASTAAAEVGAIMRIRIITTTLKKKKKEEGHEYEQGDYIIIIWSTVEGQANQSTDIIVIQGSGNVEQSWRRERYLLYVEWLLLFTFL